MCRAVLGCGYTVTFAHRYSERQALDKRFDAAKIEHGCLFDHPSSNVDNEFKLAVAEIIESWHIAAHCLKRGGQMARRWPHEPLRFSSLVHARDESLLRTLTCESINQIPIAITQSHRDTISKKKICTTVTRK